MRRLFVTALAIAFTSSALAGPLTPPGAPAPTMKTLDEVEPRIAINTTNTPGDLNNTYIISQPGSYYLTEDVQGEPFKMGIRIEYNTSPVTIDLNGFAVRGVPDSNSGIVSYSSYTTIHNGSVEGWDDIGIALRADHCTLENLHILSNGLYGFQNDFVGTPPHASLLMRNVRAQSNGDWGIYAGVNTTMYDVVARGNSGGGIRTESESVIENSVAVGNFGTGIHIENSSPDLTGAVVSNCRALNNTGHGIIVPFYSSLLDCFTADNSIGGIRAVSHSRLERCASQSDNGRGIDIGDYSVARDCLSENNDFGFHATNGATIIASKAIGCDTGFYVENDATLEQCLAADSSILGFDVDDRGTLSNCTSLDSMADGMALGDHCQIIGSTSSNNQGNGIVTGSSLIAERCYVIGNWLKGMVIGTQSVVRGSTIQDNGAIIADGYGIDTAMGCRIEGNHFTGNDNSIEVADACIVVKNSFDLPNILITGNSIVGEFVFMTSMTFDAVSTNELANFLY